LDAVFDSVHAPPLSAVPSPDATVRLNESLAYVDPTTGAVTVTGIACVAVAPSLSVTVSVTVYEPAAA
jgi:hypothetical protein